MVNNPIVDCYIPCIPPRTTSQQKAQNRHTGVYYKKKPLAEAEKMYLRMLAEYRPECPAEGALKLKVVFAFPRKSKRDGAPKITRPDTDNMVKLLKDCMGKQGYFLDDAQVADEQVIKIWSDHPGIYITLTQWEEGYYLRL